jgi:hypothetical protein
VRYNIEADNGGVKETANYSYWVAGDGNNVAMLSNIKLNLFSGQINQMSEKRGLASNEDQP